MFIMFPLPFIILLLSFALCGVMTVHGKPFFMLTNTRSKCFSVIAPQGQTITVTYHVPDMHLVEEPEEEEQVNKNKEAIEQAVDNTGEGGMDADWNRRMKEKLERMRTKKMRDMSIVVEQKGGLSGALASRQRRTYKDGDVGIFGQGRVREELSQREGSITFLTGEDDGTVNICVQSILANKNNPSRVFINVTMASTEKGESGDESETKKDKLAKDAVKNQMTRLERDLQTLTSRVKAIHNNADFNKDQEVAFQDQSVAMHRAATYWPIIQLMVMVITGFTQVNHIVRFMKTHHIGL